MKDTTIVYYSSNRESPSLEKRAIQTILENCGNLPIISVTQKPMDFGKNICVGEQPACYSNAFKQLAIGLEEAKTTFALAGEADCFYPPEYFRFEPPVEDKVYRYDNIYVYYPDKGKYGRFWKKLLCEGAQICGIKYWLENIDRVFARVKKSRKEPSWEPVNHKKMGLIFGTRTEFSWTSENPVVSVKTRRGVNYGCGFFPGSYWQIPYWGTAQEVYEKWII